MYGALYEGVGEFGVTVSINSNEGGGSPFRRGKRKKPETPGFVIDKNSEAEYADRMRNKEVGT